MSDKPSSIRNLGPASDAFFDRADIKTAEEIRMLGADEAYLRALKAGGKPHFIGYYALVMGLQGRSWNDVQRKEKIQLKERFERIKEQVGASNSSEPDIDTALDALGVVRKP